MKKELLLEIEYTNVDAEWWMELWRADDCYLAGTSDGKLWSPVKFHSATEALQAVTAWCIDAKKSWRIQFGRLTEEQKIEQVHRLLFPSDFARAY